MRKRTTDTDGLGFQTNVWVPVQSMKFKSSICSSSIFQCFLLRYKQIIKDHQTTEETEKECTKQNKKNHKSTLESL